MLTFEKLELQKSYTIRNDSNTLVLLAKLKENHYRISVETEISHGNHETTIEIYGCQVEEEVLKVLRAFGAAV